MIEKHAGRIDDLVDVGCGDLTFWDGRDLPETYTGIDGSGTIIERNRRAHPDKTWIQSSADAFLEGVKAKAVFCLDVLFHIMDDSVYEKKLSKLNLYSSGWVFVHTWSKNPFSAPRFRFRADASELLQGNVGTAGAGLWSGSSVGVYQRYSVFEVYLPIFAKSGFGLVSVEQDSGVNEYGSLYVLRLKQANRHAP
jgi:trans-aconitate methyltransferase